jgi:hypothetical protein
MSNEIVPVREVRATSLAQVRPIGEILAKSGFFADSRQAAQAISKVLAGCELGLKPFASMTGIYLVKGRLTLSALAMATLIQNFYFPGTGVCRFKFRVDTHSREECAIVFSERDSPSAPWEKVGIATFDLEDAKLAGLGGDNWRKYPRNMLYARAMSNGCKWYCPAVFAGHGPYLPDEIDGRAEANDQGGYVVDGQVVQSMEVRPADIIEAEVEGETKTEPAPADWKVPCEPGTPLFEVQQLIEETASDVHKIYARYKVGSLSELTSDALSNCRTILLAKKRVLDAKA